MRYLLTALLLLPVLVSAQELHTFKNGEVADADKLNESLQYILNNASGGCSATQQSNSVLIECADGSSGAIAGYGVVVNYPDGVTEAVVGDYKSGDIVFMDSNDVVLGIRVVHSVIEDNQHTQIEGLALGDPDLTPSSTYDNPIFALRLANEGFSPGRVEMVKGNETVDGLYWPIHFQYLNCTEAPWVNFRAGDLNLDNVGFNVLVKSSEENWFAIADVDSDPQQVLVKSRLDANGGCVNEESVMWLDLAAPFTLPDEILNTAYPVRLEQLP